MAFVQIIDVRTKDYEGLKALSDEFFAGTEGTRTLRRSLVTRDRNDPDRYVILAFFDSYESAMENSKLPETAAFAEKQSPLLEGPASYDDLDVLEDRT